MACSAGPSGPRLRPLVSIDSVVTWSAKGATGWLGLLSDMTAEGIVFSRETLTFLEEVQQRLGEVIAKQKERQ